MMAYSSYWMNVCMLVDTSIWLIYLVIYLLMIVPMIYLFIVYEVNTLKSMSKLQFKLLIVILMLNLGGTPPLAGFFLKSLSFYYIMKMDLSLIFMMVLMYVIMFYVYLRISYELMLGMKKEVSWNNVKNLYFYMNMDFLMMMGMLLGSMVISLAVF